MMNKLLLLGGIACLGLAGCSHGDDPGDVEGARQASASAPKSVDQLPKGMPSEARRGAESAMGQANAIQQQANDPARVRAMQEMNRQHGG